MPWGIWESGEKERHPEDLPRTGPTSESPNYKSHDCPVNFRSGLLRFVTHHMKILKKQLYYHHGTNLEKKAAHHSQDLRFRSV